MHVLNCSQFEHHISQCLQCCGCELDSTAVFQSHTLADTVTKTTALSEGKQTLYLYREHTFINGRQWDFYGNEDTSCGLLGYKNAARMAFQNAGILPQHYTVSMFIKIINKEKFLFAASIFRMKCWYPTSLHGVITQKTMTWILSYTSQT